MFSYYNFQTVAQFPQDSLAEVEEKYKKAMVSNAQLDNEKTNYMYQVDTLKDALLELEEQLAESRRQYEEKNKVSLAMVKNGRGVYERKETGVRGVSSGLHEVISFLKNNVYFLVFNVCVHLTTILRVCRKPRPLRSTLCPLPRDFRY